MFHRLGRIAAANSWIVCVIWLALGAGSSLLAPHWDSHAQDDDVRFLPNRFTSARAYELMEKAFPQEVEASRLIFALEREDAPLTDEDFQLVDRIVTDLEELKIGKVTSSKDGLLGHRMTSGDRHCTLIQVALGSPFMALKTVESVDRASERAHKELAGSGIQRLQLYGTGQAGIGHDLTKACGDSIESTTWATVILVIVVLLMVYRAPLLALVPLATIGVSVWVALKLLAFMTLLPGVHLLNISKLFAIVILYGAGTDYCLFLISRYREELADGHNTIEALARSVGGVGQALAASAGTVMVGLGLMALAEFARVRYSGPAIALSLGVALVASLTLTPALLRLLGPTVFWPGKAPERKREGEKGRKGEGEKSPYLSPSPPLPFSPSSLGFWDRVSRIVARHPVKVWVASMVLLAPLILLGLQVKPTYRATGDLPPQTESLQGLAAIQRHFTAGEVGPITVLLTGTVDWTSPAGQLEIDHLSRGFSKLPDVAEVRSLTQPLGRPLPNLPALNDPDTFMERLYVLFRPFFQDLMEIIRFRSREFYVASIKEEGRRAEDGGRKADGGRRKEEKPGTLYVARLDVVLKVSPFESDSVKTLRLIQTWLKSERPRTEFRRLRSERGMFRHYRQRPGPGRADGERPPTRQPPGAGGHIRHFAPARAASLAGGLSARHGPGQLLRGHGSDGPGRIFLDGRDPADHRLAGAVLPVHDSRGRGRGLQHSAGEPGPGRTAAARAHRRACAGPWPRRAERSPRAA